VSNCNQLVGVIKQAAVDAVNQAKPTEVIYGVVESEEPLRITVDQKLSLDRDFLLLTSAVSDREVEMTVDHTTGITNAHSHAYEGKKLFTVNNRLKQGEVVILVRFQGGQKYLVLDRVM